MSDETANAMLEGLRVIEAHRETALRNFQEASRTHTIYQKALEDLLTRVGPTGGKISGLPPEALNLTALGGEKQDQVPTQVRTITQKAIQEGVFDLKIEGGKMFGLWDFHLKLLASGEFLSTIVTREKEIFLPIG